MHLATFGDGWLHSLAVGSPLVRATTRLHSLAVGSPLPPSPCTAASPATGDGIDPPSANEVNKDGKVIRKDCGKKTLYKGLGSRPTRPNYGVGLSLVMRLGRLRNAMLERLLESDFLKGLW
ncbi:hypothetical protein LWI29_023127 [Acer saccharum]|uniref:Uncharacterized protein n=1 Tax=Acer saccharum TaxID=4024 RepID=A0AA39W2C8_ACESA|nr:hypothetical protein LWI29_023127 [Acer saccharum]